MDQNSSNSSNPIQNDDSFDLDEELLQWLSNLPPITSSQVDYYTSQEPSSNNNYNNTTLGVLDPIVGNPIGGNNNSVFMVEKNSHLGDPPPRNVGVAGSSSGKGKRPQSEKMKAVEIERQRRQEMSTLYGSLRSMLPAEYIRGKRSTADHLHEAVRYIKDMEDNIGKLTKQRDELLKGKTGTGSSTSSNDNNSRQQYVTVTKCNEGFYEIVLKTNGVNFEENQQKLPISRAFGLLRREGISIINSISSKIGNNLMHTIHAQVENERVIDPRILQQQLIDCYV